jgi:alpha-L-fucosidase 2
MNKSIYLYGIALGTLVFSARVSHAANSGATLNQTAAAAFPIIKNTSDHLKLWYLQPAKSAMNEALPIGNGRLGALVFGGTDSERLALNEDSLWTGGLNLSGGYDVKKFGSYQAFGDLLITSGDDNSNVVDSCPSGQKPFYEKEGLLAAGDGDASTKWAVEHGGKPVLWQRDFGTARVFSTYALTSANDVPERDPQTWLLAGSNDGVAWTTLDQHKGDSPFEKRGQQKEFKFANTTPYRYYRFTFAPNPAVPHFQVAEIALGTPANEVKSAGEGYRRGLDLNSAVATTTFMRDGARHLREAFASHPAQVLVWRWSADKPGAISGRIALKGAHGETSVASGNQLSFAGILDNGLRYEARAQVLTRGGQLRAADGALQLKGCNEAVVLVAMGTNYAMDFASGYRGALPSLQKQVDDAARQGFEKLKSEHLKDYAGLFGRVRFRLNNSTPAQKALPTDLRKVEAFENFDPEMEETLFQYGRYLLISSSRPGDLPANLQGIWNDSNEPAWYSDYHANINIQMNYWLAETTNLSECHIPIFDLIRSQIPAWRRATQSSDEWKTPSGQMTRRGFAIRTSHNTMGGLGWQWDQTANAWYCQHLWEHYDFTRDIGYLRQVAYPILKETTEFWEDHLKSLPDGRLVVPNGWSPEHGPHEDGVSYNQQIVWDLFNNYVAAARALGVDNDYAARVGALREKLVGPKIGRWGQLQEWMSDRDDPNDHHRHTSHLFALYPGRQIDPVKTPDLSKAAKVSLDARGIADDSDVREWSFAWRTALYARLGDGESAHKMLQNLFSNRNTCANLFGLHPPMQIDGNFGITAAIAEMLLQSQGEEIVLLPSLPKEWKQGSIIGLKARGNIAVDLAWKNGQLESARLLSSQAKKLTLRYGKDTLTIQLKANKPTVLDGALKVTKG